MKRYLKLFVASLTATSITALPFYVAASDPMIVLTVTWVISCAVTILKFLWDITPT